MVPPSEYRSGGWSSESGAWLSAKLRRATVRYAAINQQRTRKVNNRPRARSTTFLSWIIRGMGSLLVGALLTVAIVVISAARAPTNTFSGSLTIGAGRHPVVNGMLNTGALQQARPSGEKFVSFVCSYDDQQRFAERTVSLFSFETDNPPKEFDKRPAIAPEVDWFLSRRWDTARGHEDHPDIPDLGGQYIVRIYGWPFGCAWYGLAWNAPRPNTHPWSNDGYGTWSPGKRGSGEPFLFPTRPLWPQLALNTLVFGAATFILWSVIFELRPYIRRRRGQCPVCGYSRTGLPVEAPCPECGSMQAGK